MNTEYLKRHLAVRTQVDNQTIRTIEVEDPFHHTTVVVGWSLWEWAKMLFTFPRQVEVRVKVMSDGVSQQRWFRGPVICETCMRNEVDGPGECEACRYKKGAEATQEPPDNAFWSPEDPRWGGEQ